MFTAILLSLAIMSAPAFREQMRDVDGQPAVRIRLAANDPGGTVSVRRLDEEIGRAARKVCARAYRDSSYLEMSACVKGAIEDANEQRNSRTGQTMVQRARGER